jgi:hypothetical protein
MKQAISTIKATIKHQVAQSREIRKCIHESKGKERYALWNKKRAVGEGTRYLLLAYACLRGKSYDRTEPVGSSVPYARGILSEIHAALPPDGPEKAEWTEDRIKGWLIRSEAAVASEEAA